jgi:DNA-binding response OmpR family regulator
MTASPPPSLVMLVTDDKKLTALVSGGFGEGIEVSISTASDLLESADVLEAGLLIVDCEQPEAGSGFVLLRSMTASGRSIPVVGLVEGDQIDEAIAFVRLGAKDVLKKPLRPSELGGTMRRFLGAGS